MEYHGKFGHTLGRIQQIDLVSRIELCYATCRLATQTVAPTLPGFQGIERCVQYLASHPHKPIFYSSKYYDVSNVIRLTWSGNQVEDHTTQNFLESHQDADMPEFSTEDGQFWVLSILYLVLMSAVKYRFGHL